MRFTPEFLLAVVVLVLVANPVLAEENVVADTSASGTSALSSVTNAMNVTSAETAEATWSASVAVSTYIVPGDDDYAQPTVTFDRDWLHLEVRYNYEDLETGSAWVGYNLSGGKSLQWEITPMLGGVFGNTTGIAPGYEGSLSWWKLELYSEGEYVFDTGDSSNSYFYNWSELTLSPWDWLHIGLVTQRTRVYRSDRDIQRGPLVGFTFKQLDLTTYVLNPDDGNPTVVVAVSLGF